MDEEKVQIYAYELKHNFKRIDELLDQIMRYSKSDFPVSKISMMLETIHSAASNARAYIPKQYSMEKR